MNDEDQINSGKTPDSSGERSGFAEQSTGLDTNEPMMVDFALADLALWIRRGLERLKDRTVYQYGDHGAPVNAYAYAEFPDWDLRQKLALIESAKNDALALLSERAVLRDQVEELARHLHSADGSHAPNFITFEQCPKSDCVNTAALSLATNKQNGESK